MFKDNSSAVDAERMKAANERVGLTPAGNLRHHSAISDSKASEEPVALTEHLSGVDTNVSRV